MTQSPVPLQWRLLPLSPLLLTTATTITLLIINYRQYTGDIVSQIRRSQATFAIAVQLAAQVLALLQISVAKTLFNFARRILLLDSNVDLERYAFWMSGSHLNMDWSLPSRYIVWLVTALCIAAFPGALWAGALTPVITNTVIIDTQTTIPAFSNASSHYWDSEFVLNSDSLISNDVDNCITSTDKRGYIPSCPVPALQGQLLQSASTATTNDVNEVRKHAKFDNPDWFYWGRSYGVGSGIPLSNLTDVKKLHFAPISGPYAHSSTSTVHSLDPQAYSFRETGYNSKVTCFKNESSALYWLMDDSTSSISIYWLEGALPNVAQNLSDDFPATTWWSDYSRLLAWKARAWQGENVLSIASGLDNYTQFNQTECKIDFQPAVFEVTVNVTTKNITVAPLSDTSSTELEPTGRLTSNVVSSLNLLSRMSNSHYISVLGEALNHNFLNMRLRMNVSSDDGAGNQTAVLDAVEDSLAAMIDDIFVAYGVSQILHAEETGDQTNTPAQVTLTAARIGEPLYIYITFGLNTFLVLIVLAEAVRLRLWHRLPAYDFANIKCTTFAASHGGSDIAKTVLSGTESTWDGGPRNAAFRSTVIELIDDRGGPRLVGMRKANENGYDLKHIQLNTMDPYDSDRSHEDRAGNVPPATIPLSMLDRRQQSYGYTSLGIGLSRRRTSQEQKVRAASGQ